MRDTFVKTLLEIAKKDPNVLLVTGDLGFGVLKPFWDELPDQIINVGIAEQNMTGFATGLALEGKIVYTYSIGNFPTLRTLEQIRNDAAYHNANVKIVCVGGGFVYGSLGMSHHATEDISIMRSIPNVNVFAPSDIVETVEITKAIYKLPGTCYLRLGRGGEGIIQNEIIDYTLGTPLGINEGNEIVIFSTGAIAEEVMIALKKLKKVDLDIGYYTFPTIKPLNEIATINIIKKYNWIVTVEENVLNGGFGSLISEIITSNYLDVKLKRVGINDTFSSVVGTQKYLRSIYNIDSEQIIKTVLSIKEGDL